MFLEFLRLVLLLIIRGELLTDSLFLFHLELRLSTPKKNSIFLLGAPELLLSTPNHFSNDYWECTNFPVKNQNCYGVFLINYCKFANLLLTIAFKKIK